jgi:hypothetical protein
MPRLNCHDGAHLPHGLDRFLFQLLFPRFDPWSVVFLGHPHRGMTKKPAHLVERHACLERIDSDEQG